MSRVIELRLAQEIPLVIAKLDQFLEASASTPLKVSPDERNRAGLIFSLLIDLGLGRDGQTAADLWYLAQDRELHPGFPPSFIAVPPADELARTGQTMPSWAASELRSRLHQLQATLAAMPHPAEASPANRLAGAEKPADHASVGLLRVFTNGVSDERLGKASQVLNDDTLTVNEKLTKIDGLMRFPPTASAETLGELLHVSKQAVQKTDWWIQNRKGEKRSEVGRRETWHKERAEGYEKPESEDDR